MSIPIVVCRLRKALTNNQAFQSLIQDLTYNLIHGALSIWPCEHNPPCLPLNDEEWKVLERKIDEWEGKRYENISQN